VCIGLRYASEGTYIPRAFRFLGGGYPRQAQWSPEVFTSPAQAAAEGLASFGNSSGYR